MVKPHGKHSGVVCEARAVIAFSVFMHNCGGKTVERRSCRCGGLIRWIDWGPLVYILWGLVILNMDPAMGREKHLDPALWLQYIFLVQVCEAFSK